MLIATTGRCEDFDSRPRTGPRIRPTSSIRGDHRDSAALLVLRRSRDQIRRRSRNREGLFSPRPVRTPPIAPSGRRSPSTPNAPRPPSISRPRRTLRETQSRPFLIFEELLRSGARDLYLAVTLPGARRAFSPSPRSQALLARICRARRGRRPEAVAMQVRLGESHDTVVSGWDAHSERCSAGALTAEAGPAVIWAFDFDDHQRLSGISLFAGQSARVHTLPPASSPPASIGPPRRPRRSPPGGCRPRSAPATTPASQGHVEFRNSSSDRRVRDSPAQCGLRIFPRELP